MGPAALIKAALAQRCSITVFGVSQVLIDMEPLVRIIGNDEILHVPAHTMVGPVAIAPVTAVAGTMMSHPLLDLSRSGPNADRRWWSSGPRSSSLIAFARVTPVPALLRGECHTTHVACAGSIFSARRVSILNRDAEV